MTMGCPVPGNGYGEYVGKDRLITIAKASITAIAVHTTWIICMALMENRRLPSPNSPSVKRGDNRCGEIFYDLSCPDLTTLALTRSSGTVSARVQERERGKTSGYGMR
jgi:hypothetical protein